MIENGELKINFK